VLLKSNLDVQQISLWPLLAKPHKNRTVTMNRLTETVVDALIGDIYQTKPSAEIPINFVNTNPVKR
jgi:hypothetical protein